MTPWHLRRLGVVVVVAVTAPLLAAGPSIADPIADKKHQAAQLVQQIQAQSQVVSRLSEQVDQARIKATQVDQQISAAEAKLAQTDGRFVELQGRLRGQAITQYVHGGSAATLQALSKGRLIDLVLSRTYMETAAANEQDALGQLRLVHAKVIEQQATLADARKAAATAFNQVQGTQRAAAAADALLRATLGRVQGDLVALVAAQQAELARQAQARLEAELAARAARDQASRGGFNRFTGGSGFGNLPPSGHGAGAAIEQARRQLGKPYEWGGAGPNSFDCSGLTMFAWSAGGVGLPHSAAAQYGSTARVPISDLQPGDLVFYGSPPHHVGLYVGGGQMINALHSGTNVEYDSIYMEGDLLPYGGRVG
jgi:cell wall-associated NlpC family hydrolase